jgi:hypothetical protein
VRLYVRTEGKPREVTCEFVRDPEPAWAKRWRNSLTEQSSFRQQDSVEFLESALSKWSLYRSRNRIATNQRSVEDRIRQDRTIDLLCMVELPAPWSDFEGSIGMCQFRRTWCHNFAIDFLATHPALLGEHPRISGVGTALLYGVAILAKDLKINDIWLETTDLSIGYYSFLFGTSTASDLLVLPAGQFYQVLESRFSSVKEQN